MLVEQSLFTLTKQIKSLKFTTLTKMASNPTIAQPTNMNAKQYKPFKRERNTALFFKKCKKIINLFQWTTILVYNSRNKRM